MKNTKEKKSRGKTRRGPPSRAFFWVSVVLTVALTILLEQWLHLQWWLAYVLSINVSTVAFYSYDKASARAGRWRVPEYVLHVLMFAGGTPAAFASQKLIRHKTVKGSFRRTFWLLVIAQAALVTWAAWEFGRTSG